MSEVDLVHGKLAAAAGVLVRGFVLREGGCEGGRQGLSLSLLGLSRLRRRSRGNGKEEGKCFSSAEC